MKIETIIGKYGNNGVFTIAEIGNNHMGDIEVAKQMIDSGIQAVIDWEQAAVIAEEQEPSKTVH